MATRQVGAVEVEVRANLDRYIQGLNQAEREAKDFNVQTTQAMTQTTNVTNNLTEAVVEFANQTKSSVLTLGNLNSAVSLVGSAAKTALGPIAALIGLAGIGGFVLGIQQATRAFAEWEQQQIAFADRLRVTQGALGLTTERINELSREISTRTLASVNELREASITLGSTGQITGESLERALRLLPDLAGRVGGMTQAVQLLGDALRRPDYMIRQLTDAGIRFTAEQRNMLQASHLFEDRLERQHDLLEILERQIGGEADARGRGAAGGFRRLADATSELFITLGGIADRFFGVSEGARRLGEVLERMNRNLAPQNEADRVRALEAEINRLTESIERMDRQVLGSSTGMERLARIAGLLQHPHRRELLAERERAEASRGDPDLAREEAENVRRMVEERRREELQNERVNRTLEDMEKQLKNLRDSTNRAELAAREFARTNGLAFDDARVRRFQAAQEAIRREQRRLARADQPSILEIENERIERQTQLLRFNSEERRVQQDLLQIELRMRRRGIEVDQAALTALGNRIRLMRELQRLIQVVEEATSSVFNNMANAIADFAATGKFEFKQLADSIIRDLVRIALQAFVVRPLIQAITGFANPAIASGMGVSGASMPRFQHGGSFIVPGHGGGDRTSLLVGLSPGERVDITPAGNTGGRGGRGGGAVTVINNLNSSRQFNVEQTEREGPGGSRIIEQTFNEVMKRIGRGEGDSTLGARFGMRPRTVQR